MSQTPPQTTTEMAVIQAVENNPELRDGINRAQARLCAFVAVLELPRMKQLIDNIRREDAQVSEKIAEVVREGFRLARRDVADCGFQPPDTTEDWKDIALVSGIPYERVQSGNYNYGDVCEMVMARAKGLKADRAVARRESEAAGKKSGGKHGKDGGRINCDDVRKRLESMCTSGAAWKSQRYAAKMLNCSRAVIAKVIRQSDILAEWTNTAAPVAVPLTGMVVDSAAQSRENDPSDLIPDDEVDTLMSKLIDEAEPAERARLNGLDNDGRRKIAALYSSQSRDRGRCHKRV